jgi:hypothetical protein
VAALAGAPSAGAFDTGPHFDITRDALTAEGFGDRSIQYVQVSNWFVDLYENAESVPFSGHAGFFKELVGGALLNFGEWPEHDVKAADQSHFDGTSGGFSNTAQLTNEWDRLRRAVGALSREARDANDPQMLLTVLGISLHQVQDFYSHTNWLEPDGDPLRDGPGWAAKGWGSSPTWFDIPQAVRDGEYLYSGGSKGIVRNHGSWKADDNASLHTANAKDWPGRPLYTEAHIAAYFATRQWVQAVRAHVADEAFWARAMRLASQPAGLARDQRGALNISIASGHWQGQGEACNPSITTFSCGARNGPGGSLLDLRGAVKDYFTPNVRSTPRRLFELSVPRVNDPNATGPLFDVPSSQPMQKATSFVRLQVTSMSEIDNLDVPGGADMFVRAHIGSQRFVSGVVNDRDRFLFQRPHAPFTFLKAVPSGATFSTPVTSIRVRIRTADVRNAGTDDNVYLRISDTRRFQLDKRLYNDFERGDDDTYSVPIDDALADGVRLGDIAYLQVEKSRDGLGGGWRLGGVRIWIDERLVVAADNVNQWLEDDRRAWRAPGFAAIQSSGSELPVFMQLWEMDAPLRGDHDHTDTYPWDRRLDTTVTYAPGSGSRVGLAIGGSTYGGRLGDGNRARMSWYLTTIVPQPATVTPPEPPPGQAPLADLQITAFTIGSLGSFTVTNAGTGAAGPFTVSLSPAGGNYRFPGLAPGASVEQAAPQGCFEGATYTATADSQKEVAESNETNNLATLGPVIC